MMVTNLICLTFCVTFTYAIIAKHKTSCIPATQLKPMSFCTQLCGVEWGYALYGYANEVYNYLKIFDEIELSYQELGYV